MAVLAHPPYSIIPTYVLPLTHSSPNTKNKLPRAPRADDVTETACNETQEQQARTREQSVDVTRTFRRRQLRTSLSGLLSLSCVHVPCCA